MFLPGIIVTLSYFSESIFGFADEEVLRKILGVTVALVFIKSVFFPKLTIKSGSRVVETGVGIVGGYLQGVIGTGSPAFSMYLINTEVSKQVFRATLMVIFFSTSIYRFLFSVGYESGFSTIVFSALPVVPFFIAATLLGNKLSGKIHDTYFRHFINFLHLLVSINLLFF